MAMSLKIGCDPEVFVKDSEGQLISGYDLIPGTKMEPFKVNKGAVQVDGMALEFNIDPANSEIEFVDNINTVMNKLSRMVEQYTVVIEPIAVFTKEVMDAQPFEALQLGCEPDYNAWTGRVNPTPVARNFRTAAGHLHLGWTENEVTSLTDAHAADALNLVRMLDFYLGLPSVLYDKNKKRRLLYGRAGACRVKEYGVEYRVLSNVWLRSPKRIKAVYRGAVNAFEALIKGSECIKVYGDVSNIINSSNEKAAIKIMDEIGVDYEAFL